MNPNKNSIKRYDIFYQIVNSVIRLLTGAVILSLLLHSIFSTSFIGKVVMADGSIWERTLNIPDSPFKHLLILFLVLAVMVLIRRAFQTALVRRGGRAFVSADNDRILRILCLIWAVAGCIWVVATQLAPGSDPAKVYTIAMQWREQNFSAFAEGGYLFRYPFQSGIILFWYLWSFLFGIGNYVGLQMVNVAALVLVYYFLAKLAGYFWKDDRKIEPAVYIGLMLWIPLFFYITYLYGILTGMACSLGAVYMTAKYLETRKYRYMVIAALAMGIATVLKMNCLIYGIAVICFLLYDIIVSPLKEKLKSALCILLIVLGVICCNTVANRYVEHMAGCELPDGEVMVSWIVMGLQDTPLGPGGYSGYIGDVFTEYHYDTEQITEASVAEIKRILTKMAANPLDVGIPFFAAKAAFQWNDPTFIGMHLSDNRQSAITMPDAARSVINGSGRVVLSVILNYMQTLIWFGALSCLIMRRKSRNLYELMGSVIFLGGYMFHFAWESSSSYTIPYFVVLIPYAVKGYRDLVRSLGGLVGRRHAGKSDRSKLSLLIHWKSLSLRKRVYDITVIFICVMFLVTLAAFTRTNLFKRTLGLDDGAEALEQFYRAGEIRAETLATGYYLISPYLEQTQVLTQQDGLGSAVVTQERTEDAGQRIMVSVKNGTVTMRFKNTGEVLAAADSGVPVSYMDDSMNMFYEYDDNMKDKWKLKDAGDGTYYILSGRLALTWQEGDVLMQPLEDAKEQRWVLE